VNGSVRYIVAAVLLLFAWKGAELKFEWPQPPATKVRAPQPPAERMEWAKPVVEVLPRMTPKDRQYLANFYDAVAFILLRDGDRDTPIVSDTTKFEAFHGGSLRLAIDRKDVGKYPGLGEAIDQVFAAANGPDEVAVSEEVRAKLVAACGVLSWTFSIHGE
jgi:hypothetical protein